MEEAITRLDKEVAEHGIRIKNLEDNQGQLKEKVDDIHRMATSIELIAHDMSYMKTDVSELKDGQSELKNDFKKSQEELKDRIQVIEQEPMKKEGSKFVAIKDKLFWIILTAIAVYTLTQLFPGIKF